jgi:hypothetical protein
MTVLGYIVLNSNERIVFHTTSASFDAFDEAYLGTGVDNNSALGFFFSDNPENIILYTDTDSRVLVSAVRVEKPYGELSYYELFGYQENGGTVTSKEDFASMRDNLLIHGYDSIEYEDNEEAMLIALSASSIRPLAWFSVDQATELGKQIGSLADPEDDKARLVCLQTVLSGLNTDTPYLR